MDAPIKDFTLAEHTIILSDIHLSNVEPPHPHNKYWKRFKRPEYFVDEEFKKLLDFARTQTEAPIELILNGDIFDFDGVMNIPENPPFKVNWLERKRGLAPEEAKSRFKMKVILNDHPAWVQALREFVLTGNRVVFIIGNHDIELHWLTVQKELIDHLNLPTMYQSGLRFCEWFYVSNKDTLIEHGNQYDAYCLCNNPINPLIRKGKKIQMRLPFGNLAGKFMLNGMGLMNPHSESSFIKANLKEYVIFFYRYVMPTQPLLVWTWLWGAMVTLVYSVGEGLLPAVTNPLTLDERIDSIAERSNGTPRMVWNMRTLHAHPAIFNPFKILRELWLDRAILLAVIFFGSFQFFSFLNVFISVSIWWFIIPLMLLLPIFLFYATSVQSEVNATQRMAFKRLPVAAWIAKVKRVVHGHTHIERHTVTNGIEYLNTGTWSPAYHDVECTQPFGRKCFAWIRPLTPGSPRIAELYEWFQSEPRKLTEKIPGTITEA